MKAVFKLHADCGRMGTLEGLFVADKEAVKWLIDSEIEVYFGEVLGKHSEIIGSITDKDITLVSDKPEVVAVILDNDLQNGFDPFDYRSINSDHIIDDESGDMTIAEIYESLHKTDN